MVERNRRNVQAYDLKVTVPGADIFFGIKYPGIAGVSPAVAPRGCLLSSTNGCAVDSYQFECHNLVAPTVSPQVWCSRWHWLSYQILVNGMAGDLWYGKSEC